MAAEVSALEDHRLRFRSSSARLVRRALLYQQQNIGRHCRLMRSHLRSRTPQLLQHARSTRESFEPDRNRPVTQAWDAPKTQQNATHCLVLEQIRVKNALSGGGAVRSFDIAIAGSVRMTVRRAARRSRHSLSTSFQYIRIDRCDETQRRHRASLNNNTLNNDTVNNDTVMVPVRRCVRHALPLTQSTESAHTADTCPWPNSFQHLQQRTANAAGWIFFYGQLLFLSSHFDELGRARIDRI